MTTYQLADLIIKGVAGIGAILAGLWAVYQYLSGVETGFRKPLWERQLDLYFQACEAASILANHEEGSAAWREAEKKFWMPYWGPLAVVEDSEHVSPAMIEFGEALSTVLRNPELLRERSFELAQNCRSSITKAWKIKLADIAPRDPKRAALDAEASERMRSTRAV
jgi:hypothetical protein